MIGLLGACALLLGVAGVAKLLRPDPTVRAARALDLAVADHAGPTLVRVLGGVEIGIAAGVLVAGGPGAAAALALAYLLLTAVAVRLLAVAPDGDCGCFGTAREPVSRLHIAVNAACALLAVACIALPQPALSAAVAAAGVGEGSALVLGVGVLTALLGATMTALPALTSARAKVATPR